MDGTRSASKWTVGWEVSSSCCSLICVLFLYFIWQMIYLPFTLQMWCFQLWGYIMGTLYLVTAMGRYESHASGWSCWFSGTTPWYSSRGGSCHSRDNREMLADVSMPNPLGCNFNCTSCLRNRHPNSCSANVQFLVVWMFMPPVFAAGPQGRGLHSRRSWLH